MLFTVEDTGIGIPAHEVHRIFENFHRAHNQKGRSFEGTGMGLALTQQLVNLHGGHMKVESTFGQGTSFIVYIPVGNSHLSPLQLIESDVGEVGQYGRSIVEEAERWGVRAAPALVIQPPSEEISETTSSSDSGNVLQPTVVIPLSTRGCRILVADDNEDMRQFVKEVLLQFYEVLEASDGQIAWQIAIEQQPDLILSDVMMPGLDGYALLKGLRSSPQTRSIPFVLLSANAGDKARIEGLVAGADDYLAKPFSPKELIARVHSLLDNSRMRIALEKRVKEVSKDLRDSEERFRYSIFYGYADSRLLSVMSPIGIARVSHSGQVIYGNPKWMEMCGHPTDDAEFSGRNLSELVHPDDRQKLEELWGHESKKFAFELRWGALDEFVWVMGELVPEIVADEHRGFIAVLTDITERRRLESAKLQAAEDARAREGLAIGNILAFSIDSRHHLPRITKSVKRYSQ
jgi:PAS domain S-box-containing protein